ncbi:MAG: OmpA family protein [Desulfobacteria bacterium]
MKAKGVFVMVFLLAASGTSLGGWLDTTLEGVGKKIGNRAVNDAGDGAYGAAKGTVRDSGKEKPADRKGNPPQNSSSSSKTARQETPDTTSGRADSIEEAESVYSKFDFVPGDKMIFFDDFSDTDVGEFPRKWHLNGPRARGNVSIEVVEYQGKRFLRNVPSQKGQRQNDSTQYIRLNQKGDLPEKFTVEFDAVFSNAIVSKAKFQNEYYLYLINEKSGYLGLNRKALGRLIFSGKENDSFNTTTNLDTQDEKIHRISVSVNGTFVKGYVDNIRVINDPDGIKRPVTLIGLGMGNRSGYMTDKVMVTNFRLAEGGKNVKSALDTDGRIVTHGILFDTGKDTIKPESLPTLKMILALLNDDPGLKFSIEGHTDNQGNKGINQPLSEKRAEAVKTWLAGKSIETSRLTTKGFGDTAPIDSNKTAEGRANNRRVEFVKF